MITVTALGTGVCASHYHPEADCRRMPPGFLIEYDGHRLLLDCSQMIAYRLEERGFPIESIETIAISHSHPDHCAIIHHIQSVFAKGLWGGGQCPAVLLLLPDNIYDNFKTLWTIYNPDVSEYFPWPKLILVDNADHGTIPLTLPGGAILKTFPVYHGFGKTPAYAFRFEYESKVITYSGDTGFCTGIIAAATDADLFICEASSRIHDRGNAKIPTGYGHLTPHDAGVIAYQAQVKELFLTHYTGLDPQAAMIAECRASGYTGPLVIGYDAWKTTL